MSSEAINRTCSIGKIANCRLECEYCISTANIVFQTKLKWASRQEIITYIQYDHFKYLWNNRRHCRSCIIVHIVYIACFIRDQIILIQLSKSVRHETMCIAFRDTTAVVRLRSARSPADTQGRLVWSSRTARHVGDLLSDHALVTFSLDVKKPRLKLELSN